MYYLNKIKADFTPLYLAEEFVHIHDGNKITHVTTDRSFNIIFEFKRSKRFNFSLINIIIRHTYSVFIRLSRQKYKIN